MLCRVVREADADVRPIPWAREASLPAARPTVVPSDTSEPPGPSVEQRLQEAFESGIVQGEARSRAAAEAAARPAIENLVASIRDLEDARNEALRRAEADVVRLSIEIARRILHREVSLDSSAVEGLVRAALDKLRSEEIQRVRVHPGIEQAVRECMRRAGRSPDIELIADPGQPEGGAVFEISRGSLDASIETQLKEIERGLTDTLKLRQ